MKTISGDSFFLFIGTSTHVWNGILTRTFSCEYACW